MPYTSEAAFQAASQEFIIVINGCLDGLDLLQQQGENIAELLNLSGFPDYQAAKFAYVTAFQISLAEIDIFQGVGIAHYNPAYLQQAHQFLGSLMGAELDHIGALPQLIQGILDYTNLYNTGRWTNILTWSQQRELGNYRASFIAWFQRGATPEPPNPGISLKLLVHLQGTGDVVVNNNEFGGTRGESRRLEGFQINIAPAIPGLGCRYMAHLQDIGDVPWVTEGQFVGTRGESRGLEGFAIELTGPSSGNYNAYYMAHLENIGDTVFFSAGQFCGTRGRSLQVEGMLVHITSK
jgi:Clostridial hydrophobic W